MTAFTAYRANKIVDVAETTRSSGQSVHYGPLVVIHSAAPPSVAEYDAWLLTLSQHRNRLGFAMTAAKLRRAVVMRRSGCTFKEIGAALGCTLSCVRGWLVELPTGLRA